MGMDWGDVATWFAAVVAVVAAVISVWWPWHNRPHASWFFVCHSGNQLGSLIRTEGLAGWVTKNPRGMPDFLIEAFNDGDGSAFNVKVSGEGCDVAIVVPLMIDGCVQAYNEPPMVPVLNPGDRMLVGIWSHDGSVALLTHWLLQPTRLDKRVYYRTGLVGEHEAQPKQPIPEKSHTHHPWLWWYRLTHWRLSQSRLARLLCIPIGWLAARRRDDRKGTRP